MVDIDRHQAVMQRARAAIERMHAIEDDLALRCTYDEINGITYDEPRPEPAPQMVYRTYEPRPTAAQTTLTDEQSRGWNSWLQTAVSNALERFAQDRMIPLVDALGDEVGKVCGTASRQHDAAIAELAQRVSELEQRVSELEADSDNVLKFSKTGNAA